MTPRDIAEKICNKLFIGCSIECRLDPNFKEVEWVSEQITQALAEQIERDAKIAENGRFFHEESLEAKWGKACATAIRAQGVGK